MLKFFFRFNVALFFYGLFFTALGVLHDYPQLRKNLHDLRHYDQRVAERQWLGLFYLVNEAGSGLKFLLTGDEYHLQHYPSPSHLLAARTARANNGDWQAQLQLARMHFAGEHTAKDNDQSLYWLQQAKLNAPAAQGVKIDTLIKQVSRAAENRADAPSIIPSQSTIKK